MANVKCIIIRKYYEYLDFQIIQIFVCKSWKLVH